MSKPLALASILLLAIGLATPALRASDESDRGWQQLNAGNLSRARWIFEQALKQDPCDASARKGLLKAGGGSKTRAVPCVQDADAADSDHSSLLPTPDDASELPTAADLVVTPVSVSTVPPDAAAAPAAAGMDKAKVWEALWSIGRWILGLLVALGILAGLVHLCVRLLRGRTGPDLNEAAKAVNVSVPPSLHKLVAQYDARTAAQAPDPVEAAEPEAAPAPSLAALAPAPLPKPAPAAGTASFRPFGPNESVRLSLKAGQEEVFLTDKKLYWSGQRRLLGLFQFKPTPMVLALPFGQITGVAWAKPKGGDLLVIGTALAGDIVLRAVLFGAVPLQAFAKALSEAMDSQG
jgi:hypothetical protein